MTRKCSYSIRHMFQIMGMLFLKKVIFTTNYLRMLLETIQDAPTAYYHLQAPCDISKCDFKMKVTLRRVTGGIEKDLTVERVIRWQEKIQGPNDACNNISDECLDPYKQCMSLDPRSRVNELSMNHVESKDGDVQQSTMIDHLHGMALYTFVDQDYFIPLEGFRNQAPCTTTHISAGIQALPIHTLHTKETLHRTTAGRIHERLTREDPVQYMSIMAAVDLDMKVGESAVDMNGKSTILGYEKVLCILRLHRNGILEIRPDFSQKNLVEHYHDSNIFVHEDTLAVWRKHGIPLSTYNFRSASGILYQYCLELLNSKGDHLESCANYKIDCDKQMILSRSRTWLGKIKNRKNPEILTDAFAQVMLMEISSAQNFSLQSSHFSSWRESTLCIHFSIVLDDSVQEGQVLKPNYKLLLSGQSQQSKYSQSHSKYTPLRWSGPKILLLLVYLEMVVILKVNWLILTCAILMVTLLTNLSTRFDYSDKGSSYTNKNKSSYHFGHLVDIPISCSPTRSRPSPILFVQVINKTRFFETLVGIGFVRLPTIQGRYDLVISTMKPLGHRHENATQNALIHYYFGLPKLDVQSMISLYKDIFNQKESLVQSSGSVNIRLEVLNS